MIIDIRGTNGSGKSHPIHTILKEYPHQKWVLPEHAGEEVQYTLVESLDMAIIGTYDTQCGGADGVTKQDAITNALRLLHPIYKTVVVEGSIVASVYSRWEALAREVNDDYQFWFLDTPVEECIASVMARRTANGNTKPFDPNQTLIPRHEAILRLKQRLLDAGRVVFTMSRETITPTLIAKAKHNIAGLTG